MIQVVPYNEEWPQQFQQEARAIQQVLGNNCLTVHHIGSTAVPGLSAKPIIDLLPVVKNILQVDQVIEEMKSLGYEAKGEAGMAFRRFFQKGEKKRTHHVHVYEEGDPEVGRYLKFRNWMRSHPADALAYQRLKLDLAIKFPNDRLAYCFGKDAFVASIDEKDGFSGWRLVQALTDREWATAHHLREQFFRLHQIPVRNPLRTKDHIHFIFYQNAQRIGYADIQFVDQTTAALQIFVIDASFSHADNAHHFLSVCEKWLRQQGIRQIAVEVTQEEREFYITLGYTTAPLKDFLNNNSLVKKLPAIL